jgi:hypothetical protein
MPKVYAVPAASLEVWPKYFGGSWIVGLRTVVSGERYLLDVSNC